MERDIFIDLAARWPSPIIARREVAKFSGGAISRKTLANADCKGKGPKNRMIIGNKVCYPVADLVDWIRTRVKESHS